MDREQTPQWSLTDEEWCELCFMLVELGEAQQHLQALMLADERPTLHQLWTVGGIYQRQSRAMFDYIGRQLRERAVVGEQRAA